MMDKIFRTYFGCFVVWVIHVNRSKATAISSEGTADTTTACAGSSFQPQCVSGEVIAVRNIQYGTKLTGSCSGYDCCVYDVGDCLLRYDGTDLQQYCSGMRICLSSYHAGVDATSCGSAYSILSHYMTMEYYCIPESRIAPMCGSKLTTVTGKPLYIQNLNYPSNAIDSSSTSCTCSVEALSCSSTIKVSFIHFQLYDSGGCPGTQKIQINDNGTDHEYTCSNNTGYEIKSSVFTSSTNYITVTLDNPNGVAGGHFWIAFEEISGSIQLNLNCGQAARTMCMDCLEVTVSDSTHLPSTTTSSYSTGTTVTYTCNTGYERMAGDEQITCGTDGQWTGTAPSCSLVTCPNDDSIANLLSKSPDTATVDYNTVVTYTCNVGYQLSGSQTRTCEDTGSLSGAAPTCYLVTCPNNDSIANLLSKSPDTATVDYNTEVNYTCNVGYQLNGSQTRKCEDTGRLSGAAPTCDLVTCPNDDSIANLLSKSPDTATVDYNTVVTYTCNVGYQLSGSQTRTCEDTGSLSGAAPTCYLVTCPNNDSIANLLSKSPDTATVDYNTEVNYTCNVGYQLNGSQTRKCEDTGRLSGAAPTCDHKKEIYSDGTVGVIVGSVAGAVVLIVVIIVVVACIMHRNNRGEQSQKNTDTELQTKVIHHQNPSYTRSNDGHRTLPAPPRENYIDVNEETTELKSGGIVPVPEKRQSSQYESLHERSSDYLTPYSAIDTSQRTKFETNSLDEYANIDDVSATSRY